MASQKRVKAKGRGKSMPNAKKQQILEEKIQTLTENLTPIVFIPLKILDFPKHEKLLRKLGLWEFINTDFDKKISQELIVQLVANYEYRHSNVNGKRIGVNRADLARAFKMPVKMEKGNYDDVEPLYDESIAFIEDFMLYWLLLHDDMWTMPDEVNNWLEVIKEGHPEKVDWAGLIWFMVEKELVQGKKLKTCYYAAHLQHLMKEQNVVFKEGEEELALDVREIELKDFCGADAEVVEMVDYVGPSEIEGNIHDFANDEAFDGDGLVDDSLEEINKGQIAVSSHVGPSEIVKEGELALELKDSCVGDAYNNQEIIVLGSDEDEETDEKNHDVYHDAFIGDEWTDIFPEEMNEQIVFSSHVGPSRTIANYDDLLDGDTLINNLFLEAANQDQTAFISHEDPSDANGGLLINERQIANYDDALVGDGMINNFFEVPNKDQCVFSSYVGSSETRTDLHPSFSNQAGKRVIQHDDLINNFSTPMNEHHTASSSHAGTSETRIDSHPFFYNHAGKRGIQQDDLVSDRNKRLRINDSWENNNTPTDFEMCMQDFQQQMSIMKILYEQKQQAVEESELRMQNVLKELHIREDMIQSLNNSICEEVQEKDKQIYRYEEELSLMGNVLDGYRKALKTVQKKFAAYRERVGLPEERAYKVVGPGGLMKSSGEIERNKKKQEEEHRTVPQIEVSKIPFDGISQLPPD